VRKSFGEICLMDKLESWDKLNKEDYKKQKALVWENSLWIQTYTKTVF